MSFPLPISLLGPLISSFPIAGYIISPSHPGKRPLAREVDALAGLSSRLGIRRNVGIKLLLLRGDLGAVVPAVLGLVDLEVEHLKLELENLVLDLADSQSIGRGAGRRSNCVVESARLCLSVLCSCASR